MVVRRADHLVCMLAHSSVVSLALRLVDLKGNCWAGSLVVLKVALMDCTMGVH